MVVAAVEVEEGVDRAVVAVPQHVRLVGGEVGEAVAVLMAMEVLGFQTWAAQAVSFPEHTLHETWHLRVPATLDHYLVVPVILVATPQTMAGSVGAGQPQDPIVLRLNMPSLCFVDQQPGHLLSFLVQQHVDHQVVNQTRQQAVRVDLSDAARSTVVCCPSPFLGRPHGVV